MRSLLLNLLRLDFQIGKTLIEMCVEADDHNAMVTYCDYNVEVVDYNAMVKYNNCFMHVSQPLRQIVTNTCIAIYSDRGTYWLCASDSD